MIEHPVRQQALAGLGSFAVRFDQVQEHVSVERNPPASTGIVFDEIEQVGKVEVAPPGRQEITRM